MEPLTGSRLSPSPCRRSRPPKERSYDRTLATVTPHNGVVPRRGMRRRYPGANVADRSTIVPDWNVDVNADDRPRGRAKHVRCSDADVRNCGRHEPADCYRHDSFADPVVDDDGERDERYYTVKPAARTHQ